MNKIFRVCYHQQFIQVLVPSCVKVGECVRHVSEKGDTLVTMVGFFAEFAYTHTASPVVANINGIQSTALISLGLYILS